MNEDIPSRVNRKKQRKHRESLKFLGLVILIFIGAAVVVAYKVYRDAQSVANEIYESRPEEQQDIRQESINLTGSNKESLDPFSVLLLGVDSGALGRSAEGGRSDAIMVATVNPHTKRILITSIPRDTRTNIVGYGMNDKINHAYAYGGVAMSVNTVQNLLDIPIDFTVSVNIAGMEELISAISGIILVPTLSFDNFGYSFIEGVSTHMDGAMALAYTQDRFNEDGDYGPQERQRQVISTILSSSVSVKSIANYGSILQTLQGNVQTDLSFDKMVSVFANYRSALSTIETQQLQGYSEIIDGIYYEISDSTSLAEIQQTLKTELKLND